MSNSNGHASESAISSTPSSAVLGDMVWLYSVSEMHREWAIASIHQWIIPAILHKQYRIYRKGAKPVGLVTWGFFSKDVEEAYVHNPRGLKPKDWQSGDRGWILDFIAPFGDALSIGDDLKSTVFAEDMGRYLRVKPGSSTMKVSYLHGTNRIKDAKNHSLNPTVILGQERPKH